MIEVKSLSDVILNGVHAGKVLDVAANYPEHVAELQAAMEAWQDRLSQEHARQIQAAIAAQREAGELAAIETAREQDAARHQLIESHRQQMQELEAKQLETVASLHQEITNLRAGLPGSFTIERSANR